MLAESQFELFITSDQNIRYQQNLCGRRIAIIQLSTNKLRRILNANERIQTVVNSIQAGEFRQIEIP